STNWEDVSDAISMAQDLDVIIVPSGKSTWNEGIIINKPLTISGDSSGATIIHKKTAGHIFVFNGSHNSSARLSNFTLDGENIAQGVNFEDFKNAFRIG
ncbi:MAG: hypothetical protein P1S59_14540, partial [bacterium]|nr:hypothetical protein [bacterium]